MKTAIFFIFTCFISTGAFMAALNLRNPFPAFAVAFGIWGLFIRFYIRRSSKQAERRHMERHFQEYMRHQLRRERR